MRLLIKTLGWLLTLALLAVTGLAVLLYLDSGPRVPEEPVLTQAERAWVQEWLRSARPRGPSKGEPVTLTLTEDQANLLLAYLIDRLGEGRARVRLGEDRARITASLGLPMDPGGRFVNLDLELSGSGRPPRIERLHLAGLALPEALAQPLAEQTLEALDRGHLLQSVAIEPQRIRVTYTWGPDTLASLGRRLVSPAGWERLLDYQDLIQSQTRAETRVQIGAKTGAALKGERIELADLLSRLLAEAGERSRGGDPVAENQAAILALAAYVNRRSLPRSPSAAGHRIGTATEGARLPPRAAARPCRSGPALHDLRRHRHPRGRRPLGTMGLYKEVADSRGGSGFSFADLAADRAGNRFALRAAGDPEAARAIQGLARQGLAEDAFMPPVEGLPEGLDRDTLAARFGDPQNPAYRRLASQIERSIDALQVHRASVH